MATIPQRVAATLPSLAIPAQLAQDVLTYLARQPCGEVMGMVQQLMQLQAVPAVKVTTAPYAAEDLVQFVRERKAA